MNRNIRWELHLVDHAEDLKDLDAALSRLCGVIQHVAFSYPAVPELEIESDDHELWAISMETSDWLIRSSDGTDVLDSTGEPRRASRRRGIETLEGRTVESAKSLPDPSRRALGLLLKLDDQSNIEIFPAAEEGESTTDMERVPTWAVFMPNGRVLSAGPGMCWTEYPADVPEAWAPWAVSPGQRHDDVPDKRLSPSAERSGRSTRLHWAGVRRRWLGGEAFVPALLLVALIALATAITVDEDALPTVTALVSVVVAMFLLVFQRRI